MTTANATAAAQPSLEDETVGEIPRLRTRFSAEEVRTRLDAAARKGRIPGFRADSRRALFEVRELGHPFEGKLLARAGKCEDAQTEITFTLRIRPIVPLIFAVMLVLSIWPGIYVVDSMCRQYFSWYTTIQTWWWYLPLTVPTSPWAFWSALKKSRASGQAQVNELVGKIATELHADFVR